MDEPSMQAALQRYLLDGEHILWTGQPGGRFIYKRWDRKRTVYAVTTKRVMVLRGSRLQTVFVKQLPQMHQTVRSDGSGSIEFGGALPGYGFWASSGMDFLARGQVGLVAFYDIPKVDEVARAISAAATQPPGFSD